MSPNRVLPDDAYFYNHSEEEIWRRYCGFLDLSVDEFLVIQERLLMEQIDLVHNSLLGRKILGDRKPKSVEEFRATIPLTTYEDYEPYLSEQREDALVEKPYLWMHTSGRSGRFKWIPYTTRALDVAARFALGSTILAAAHKKGEVNLRPGQRMLLLVAPRPYFTGCALDYMCKERFTLEVIPPPDVADQMDFQERLALGFGLAMRHGFDHGFALASVLARVGEAMATQARGMTMSSAMKHPATLARVGRAWLTAKRHGRAMLPADIWQPKSIMTGGTDSRIYWDDITHYWGQEPYEGYGATETYMLAVQSWKKSTMTFVPSMAFWEFIPEGERAKQAANPNYQPRTVLLNELQPGKEYEVVISHFYGMPLMRYQMHDLIRVVASEDKEAGIKLPQILFRSRVSDIIQLAGLTELDERTVWQAIANTGVKVEDWAARKEYDDGRAYVRIYVEPKESMEGDHLDHAIDQQLRKLDADYRDVGEQLELQPVRVTYLPQGSFGRYYQEMKRRGADLAHLKPPHMNAPDSAIEILLRLGGLNPN
ncbi:MAG: GH3 family acyl-acid amido synthetase [Chloroflexota bacterium]